MLDPGGAPASVAVPVAACSATRGRSAGIDALIKGLGLGYSPTAEVFPRLSVGETLAFALSNCCRGKPKSSEVHGWERVAAMLPCIAALLDVGEGDAPRDVSLQALFSIARSSGSSDPHLCITGSLFLEFIPHRKETAR